MSPALDLAVAQDGSGNAAIASSATCVSRVRVLMDHGGQQPTAERDYEATLRSIPWPEGR